MNWIQIKVTVKCENLDPVCAVMSMISNGLQIEDYSDIEDRILDGVYGDLIDESVLNADREHASVSVYVSADKPVEDYKMFITEKLDALKIQHTLEVFSLCEEDWADSWKQYYKPINIGEKLVVVPMWEKYDAKPHEVIVKMDPGMAFGTGTHETTRLVMRIMQDELRGGERVLDVGTGSGILSICASKLGAASCNAYDIDPVAVKVARENAKDDGCDNITVGVSDLLAGVDLSGGKYNFCVANIVADIIIRMMPDISDYLEVGAPLILSGIIAPRADEVREAVRAAGFEIVREEQENDWLAIMAKLS